MNIDIALSNLILIQSELSNNPSDIEAISNELDKIESVCIENEKGLEIKFARLFPVQNYIYYNTDAKSQTLIDDIVKNYRPFIQNFRQYANISDFNPMYIRPILSPNPLYPYFFDCNIPTFLDLRSLFTSVTGTALSYSSHYINNPRDNIRISKDLIEPSRIDGNLLTILPDWRNQSYSIHVFAYDYFRSVEPAVIEIQESDFPDIPVRTNVYEVWMGKYNNNNILLNLDSSNTIDTSYSDQHSDPFFFDTHLYSRNVSFFVREGSNIATVESNVLNIATSFTDIFMEEVNDTVRVYPYPTNYPESSSYYKFDSIEIRLLKAPYHFNKSFSTPLIGNDPFFIDMKQFQDKYFIIDDNTDYDVSFSNVIEANRLDINLPLVNIDNNIITLYPDYRDSSYLISLSIYNPYQFSLSNIIDIVVSETFAVSPHRNEKYLNLNDKLFDTSESSYSLAPYFENPSRGDIKYIYSIVSYIGYSNVLTDSHTVGDYLIENDSSNGIDNSMFYIDGDYIVVTPDLRFISYQVNIFASNITYNTIDTNESLMVQIMENRPVILYNKIDDLSNMTNIVHSIDLTEYMISPVQNLLTYEIVFDTSNRLHLDPAYIQDSNILVINPDYRDEIYNIYITGIDPIYIHNPLTYRLSIHETFAPYPKPLKDTYLVPIKLNNNAYFVDLDSLFEAIEYESSYVLMNSNAYHYIDGSNLIILPDMRGTDFSVDVYGVNTEYESFKLNDSVNIIYHENPPVLQVRTVSEFNKTELIDLNTLFISPIDNKLEYIFEYLNTIPRQSLFDNSNAIEIYGSELHINVDYRDIQYDFMLTVYDSNYPNQTCNVTFTIKEPPPLKVSLWTYLIELNKESFRLGDIKEYDLSFVFNQHQLAYYSAFQYSIINRYFIPDSISLVDSNLYINNIIDLNLLDLPIQVDILSGASTITANSLYISFVDIPTVYVTDLTITAYVYDLNYWYQTYKVIYNPYSNISIDGNKLSIKPNFRGSIIDGGHVENYDIKIEFNDTMYLYLNITELPPFYVDSLFYKNNDLHVAITDNTPYIFNPILTYIKKNTKNLEIVFQENIDSNVRISNYPIVYNDYYPPFVMNKSNGQVTIYPDYRDQAYTISIMSYMDSFPEKYLIANYHITEPKIPNIVNDNDIVLLTGLGIESRVLYLRDYYTSYVFNKYLRFDVSNMNPETPANYQIDNFILIINSFARNITYDLQVYAVDDKFNNVNSNLYIHVEESLL